VKANKTDMNKYFIYSYAGYEAYILLAVVNVKSTKKVEILR